MRPTDLANPAWLTAMVRHHHRDLAMERLPVAVHLLDVRIRNPHLPDSKRCQGWATVRVRVGATDGLVDGPVLSAPIRGQPRARAGPRCRDFRCASGGSRTIRRCPP